MFFIKIIGFFQMLILDLAQNWRSTQQTVENLTIVRSGCPVRTTSD